MISMKHTCVKCGKGYSDELEDDYYCFSCQNAKKALAAKIDAEVKARGPRRHEESMIQRYERLPKRGGFVNAREFLL